MNISKILIIFILCVIGFVMFIPFLWLVSSSLKPMEDIWVFPPKWIPNPPRWDNYYNALTYLPFVRYILNTLFITFMVLVGVLLTSSIAGYAFARLRFPGKDFIFYVLLSTMMLPYIVTLIPIYIMFKNLGWLDTYKPLIIPAYFGGGAFNIFLFRQFFMGIPQELVDSARIDGASEPSIFFRIIIPLSMPVVVTIAIFTFLGTWNDFMGPLLYLQSPQKLTVAVGLSYFRGMYSTQWNYLMAASTVMIIPPIILFLLAQRYFVRGIVLTGLKG